MVENEQREIDVFEKITSTTKSSHEVIDKRKTDEKMDKGEEDSSGVFMNDDNGIISNSSDEENEYSSDKAVKEEEILLDEETERYIDGLNVTDEEKEALKKDKEFLRLFK